MRALRLVAAFLCALWSIGCARSTGNIALGNEGRVELVDTLPALAAALAAPSASTRVTLTGYARQHRALFAAAGVTPDLNGLEVPGLSQRLEVFEAEAPGELNALINDLAAKLGRTPRLKVAFAAVGAKRPVCAGTLEGTALLLVDGADTALTTPAGRRTWLARALFKALQLELQGPPASLSPLTARLFQEGAAMLAARLLVPNALEHQVLGIDAAALSRVRSRQPLLAKELLAGLDSAKESEVGRFFGATSTDPLVPLGAGAFLADQLFQRLAAEDGSSTAPLRLSPADFPARARKVLGELAGGR